MKNRNQYFAEIVESSLQRWTAQSWIWNKFPSFGSLIVVEQDDLHLYGIVSEIQTGSSDPSRLPHAYQKTEQELLNDHPQIFEFLRTIFNCIPVAYKKAGFHYSIPPKPAKIHSFVRQITDLEKSEFQIAHCLPVLFSNSNFQILDDLLLALIKNLNFDSSQLHSFIQDYSLLCGNDYRRMKVFINRLENSVE